MDQVDVVVPKINGTVKDGVFHPDEKNPFVRSLTSKLQAALAKAQGAFPVIPKDSEVEVKSKEGKFLYKYKYADLTTIISCTRPAMSSNGLSFTQGMVSGGFATTIMHDSGEILRTGFIPCEIPKSQDMKQIAALITYVKRISLTAALGVSADEDVDAGSLEANAGNSTNKPPAGKDAPPKKPAGAQAKKDPHPPVENQDDKRAEALAYLINLDKKKKLGAEYVKASIKRVVGSVKRADTLTEAELVAVIDFIESNNP